MKRCAVILLCCLGVVGSASATDKTDVLAVVQAWVKAFNAGDPKAAVALCADDAVIVDVLAPYVWKGPGSCGAWAAAFGTWIKENDAVVGKTRLGKVKFTEITGDRAYLDVAASFSMTVKGKPAPGRGTWTFAMSKASGAWRVIGWSWAEE